MTIQEVQKRFSWRRGETIRADSSMFSVEEWQAIAPRLELSRRELEVAQGVFDALKENRIAEQLNISPHTVHAYLERLYSKCVVSGRVQMVLVLVKMHLSLTTPREDDAVLVPGLNREGMAWRASETESNTFGRHVYPHLPPQVSSGPGHARNSCTVSPFSAG